MFAARNVSTAVRRQVPGTSIPIQTDPWDLCDPWIVARSTAHGLASAQPTSGAAYSHLGPLRHLVLMGQHRRHPEPPPGASETVEPPQIGGVKRILDLRKSRKAPGPGVESLDTRAGRMNRAGWTAASVARAWWPMLHLRPSVSHARVSCPADGRIPAICPVLGRKLDSRAWEIGSLRVALLLLWSAASIPVYTWRMNMESTDLTLTILQNIRSDIAALGGRFDNLEGRFDNLEGRFDHLEHRFDNLEGRFDHLEGRFDHLDGKFDNLEGEVAAMRKDMQGFLTRDEFRGAMLAMNIAQNERHERLEKRMNEIDTRSATSQRVHQDTLDQLMAQVGQHGSLAARITLCERDIVDLKRRVL
jgi:hypothetical protein